MARPKKSVPGYLHHKASGRAFVRINGINIYLGPYNSKASKEEYNRIRKEWLANDGQLIGNSTTQEPITVNGLCIAFLEHAKVYYRKNGSVTTEVGKIKVAGRLLHEHCGEIPATEFTRKSLKKIREKIIALGWKRKTVNERIGHIKRVFKWAAQEDLIPASVYQELQIMSGLKKGRSSSPESKPVPPVSLEDFEKTLPFCPPIVADMARIQYLAGMRPGEICTLRACDIDRSGDVWVYVIEEHKTSHHGHERTVWFGQRAQAILTSYLMDADGDPEKYLFSPQDGRRLANIEKRQKRKSKVQPSQICRAKKHPKKAPGEYYQVSSYRRALYQGAEKAGVEQWSPNQLRHTRATEIRKVYGLEAAQIILGHAKADVTQIYAERDKQKGIDIMRAIG